MSNPATLYLASASPRRQELLQQIGVDFTLLGTDAHEDPEALEAVLPGETPARYVVRVTRLKLQAARQRLQRRGSPAAAVLCADTTVSVAGAILGKPRHADEAAAMLSRLAGRRHRVLTAVALAWPGPDATWEQALALSISRVQMAALTARDIEAYVATGEPFGKAGAYAVQGCAATLIRHIRGSHSGIMGLPLFETAALLRRAGVRTCADAVGGSR